MICVLNRTCALTMCLQWKLHACALSERRLKWNTYFLFISASHVDGGSCKHQNDKVISSTESKMDKFLKDKLYLLKTDLIAIVGLNT